MKIRSTEAVLAVVAAKPDTPVALLADGDVALTAFIPNDLSFKRLVRDLTGAWYWKEQQVFDTLASVAGIDTIEAVLLYHAVPGATIDSATALSSDGAVLQTALSEATFSVDVVSRRGAAVRLVDNDPSDRDPWLNRRALDINEGNLQIAHGIWRVLRPIDL